MDFIPNIRNQEKLLYFTEIYLGIFFTFSLKGMNLKDKSSCVIEDRAVLKLEEYGIKAHWQADDYHVKNFINAEKFLLSRLPKNRIRLKIEDPINHRTGFSQNLSQELIDHYSNTYHINKKLIIEAFPKHMLNHDLYIFCPLDPNLSRLDDTRKGFLPLDIFLSIFPDSELGILFFNMALGPSSKKEPHCDRFGSCSNINTDYLIFRTCLA